MKKKTIVIIIFVVLIGVFVFPSFRFSGVDCLAGCSMPKGLPLPYSIFHAGGVIFEDGSGASSKEFLLLNLLIDLLVWFGVANIFVFIGSQIAKLFSKKSSEV